jgi:hypothetical protein
MVDLPAWPSPPPLGRKHKVLGESQNAYSYAHITQGGLPTIRSFKLIVFAEDRFSTFPTSFSESQFDARHQTKRDLFFHHLLKPNLLIFHHPTQNILATNTSTTTKPSTPNNIASISPFHHGKAAINIHSKNST